MKIIVQDIVVLFVYGSVLYIQLHFISSMSFYFKDAVQILIYSLPERIYIIVLLTEKKMPESEHCLASLQFTLI